jgi:hypothetical protein
MSNCVVAVAELPIVRAASRLALRAPALRAAAALLMTYSIQYFDFSVAILE